MPCSLRWFSSKAKQAKAVGGAARLPRQLGAPGRTARRWIGVGERMAGDTAETNKKRGWSWVVWWSVDDDELQKQVSQYHTLKFHQTTRGLSLILTLISAAISALMIEFSSHERWSYLDSGLLVGLGVFIVRGHRWAMVGAMVLWTVEKTLQLVTTLQSGQTAPFVGI